MSEERPEALEFEPGAVSDTLRERDNWVAWRYEWKSDREEWTKIPIDVATGDFGKSTDPRTWSSFADAVAYHDDPATDTDGVGFVVSDDDLLVGVDLDDCRDPDTGEIDRWARDLLTDVPTYAEVSPSGTGLRLFGLGFVPDGGNRGDIDDARGHVEVYDNGRYLTVTGHAVEESPATIEQVNNEIESIHEEYIRDETAKVGADGGVQADSPGSNPGENTLGSVDLTDETLLEKAKSAQNGDDFKRLWDGSTAGYASHSEARLALLNHLAFWTGGDDSRMLALFKKSDLYRGDDDDRKLENYDIPTALESQTDFYDPDDASTPDGPTIPDEPIRDASRSVALRPDEVKARAGLGEDGEISDLTDRQKAACVWDLIWESDTTHVRVRRDNGSLWSFDNGVWKPEGERALRHAARRALSSMNYGQNVLAELKAQARSDPRAEVEADTFGLEAGALAVENGLIDLKGAAGGSTDARRELTPEDYALTQLPVEYDPDAGYEEWNDLVEEWTEEGRADALQEYVGYTLHRGSMPIHRALLLVGSGANGKGTFLHVVRQLLGADNTSSIELQTLANERDAVADFYGSLANIDDDLSSRQLGGGLGMFKKLVAGDRVRARRLYEDGFEYSATGKHLYAANEVPEVNVPDDDEAFWRRWLLVEFPNHYPPSEREPDLRDRLTTDEALSGVLNWAIEGWDRLLEQGHFTNEEHEAYAKRERWQSWGESVDKFLSDCVERDEDAKNITTKQAYNHYLAWCEANGLDPVRPQRSFTTKLKGENVGHGDSVRVNGKVTRGYKALGFTDDLPRVVDSNGDDDASTSLDSFEESTGATGDEDGDDRLTQRVRDFLESNYGPRAEVTVPNVAGALEAPPARVESVFTELGDAGALEQTPDGWLYQGVTD